MSFLKELTASLSRVAGMVTPEELFAYSSDADKLYIYRFKLNSFFNRFGLEIKPSQIKRTVINKEEAIIIPTTFQIHGGTISPKALEKLKEEIKENQFVDVVEFDESTGDLMITFLKNIELA